MNDGKEGLIDGGIEGGTCGRMVILNDWLVLVALK